MKSFPRVLLIIVSSVAIVLTGHVYLFIHTPVSPGRAVLMEITVGTSAWRISSTLEQKHIITNAPTFLALALLTKKARTLQAGTYVFEGRHTPFEILDILYKGKSLRYKLTVPEGSNIFDIGELLGKTGMFSRNAFIETARQRDTAHFFSLDAPSMEGFLYPDTYYLGPNMTPKEIIARMVRRFRQMYTPDMQRRAHRLGLTDLEVLTLASMIEKEAVSPSEKPIISSVFHNRLRKGMRLQSDPTAVYGIEGFHRDITPEDLKRDTLYNTYLHKGLPPGPICNPDQEAIMAALWPEETSHLFFVSKGDGHHYFSASLKEHNEAIQRSKTKHH